ncbi:hypothetical protein [Nostoc sp. MG11]|uniref:hypothetical protein n=1 Tax=Nostoc sp. MG11 TaxID=2721166 RepID=UPI001865E23E|nr:hypothetical protein [Nostoc sp. MG11]
MKLTTEPTIFTLLLSTPIDFNPTFISTKISYVLDVQVSFQGRPTETYSVYINLPNITTANKAAYYAGVMSFFELPSKERVTKTLLFDITDKLIEQVKNHEQPLKISKLTLTFVKENGFSSQEDIVVEGVSLHKYDHNS